MRRIPIRISGTATVSRVCLPNRAVGVSDFLYTPTSATGQQGTKAWVRANGQGTLVKVPGLNNTGLLAKTSGKVTGFATNAFFLDDGSGYDDGNSATPGIKVSLPTGVGAPALGDYVSVTGISSCYKTSGKVHRLLKVRASADILLLD